MLQKEKKTSGRITLSTQKGDLLVWVNFLKPWRTERIFGRDALVRIEVQHFVQKVESLRWHKLKVLSQATAMRLLLLKSVEQGQFNDIRPHGGHWRAADLRYGLELGHLGIGLEQRTLHKEFAKNAATRPDIDRRTIPLLAQQKLRRTIPQGYYFVRIRTFSIVGVV